MCEAQKWSFLGLIRVKNGHFLVSQTFESPEISVKLGDGGGGSRFFLELCTKCEVFAVIFFGGSP